MHGRCGLIVGQATPMLISFLEHITHSDCFGAARVEHYGIEFWEHTWPDEVDGTPTYQLMWTFLVISLIEPVRQSDKFRVGLP